MKLFVAFFVALLAIHASTQSPVKDDSIKEIVVLIMNEILSTTDKLLSDVKTEVAHFEADEDGETQKIVDLFAEEAAKWNSLVIKVIDELKDGASDDGVAALECIDAQEENANSAAKNTFSTIAQCISESYDSIFTEVDHVLEELQDLQDDFQGQTDTLKDCSDSEMTCLTKFVTTSLETAKKVYDAVQADIPDIVSLIQEVLEHMGSCDIESNVKANILEIFENAVTCIKNI